MREEKELKELLSDEILAPKSRFRNELRRKVMSTQKTQSPRHRSWLFVPVTRCDILVIAFATMQLLPGFNDKTNIITRNNPLAPQPLRATTIQGKSEEFRSNLKNTAFFMSTVTHPTGPKFDVCYIDAMGIQPGQTSETYTFMSKETGSEAFFQKKTRADGGVLQTTSYYSKSGTQLSNVVGSDLRTFSIDDPLVVEVDKQGNPLPKASKYSAVKEGSRYVYKIITASTQPSQEFDFCEGKKKLTQYVVDANSFVLLRTEHYSGSPVAANLIDTYKTEVSQDMLSESQALKRMEKAGFDRSTALSEFPAHIPN